MMSVKMAIITTFLIACIIICERAFPFVLFSKKTPPKILHFLEKYIPPVVMGFLCVWALKDIRFDEIANWMPAIAGVLIAAVTHLWKKNTLISIFGSTILYMVLIRVL